MTSIFDRWTDLDPALALRRIEAAHGSAIFDRDSYTDPQRAIRQIEAALGIELDDVAGLQDPRTLEAAIDDAVSAPEWLPSGALAFVDFQNGHYYAGGAEVADLTTIFGTDAGFGTTFSVDDVSASGLSFSSHPSFLGALLLDVLGADGSTSLFEVTTSDSGACEIALDTADSSDYNFELLALAETAGVGASTFYNGASSIPALSNNTDNTPHAINRVAMTISPTKLAMSVNGETAETAVPVDGTYVSLAAAIVFGGWGFLHSITVYPPQADADLPALSALS